MNSSGANFGCQLVAEYVDQMAIPSNAVVGVGEIVRPHVVASYVDHWTAGDSMRDFTVLLKDNRIVTVRGHALKHIQDAAKSGDAGSYAILVPSAGGDITVAFFPVSEVTGIFCGSVRVPAA